MKLLAIGALLSIESSSFTALAFAPSSSSSTSSNMRRIVSKSRISSTQTDSETNDAFSAFAESIDENDIFDDTASGAGSAGKAVTWQESLEMLLDPGTPAAKRQILLSDLLNSNDDIRNDVQNALKEKKVCNVLCIVL